MNTLPRRCLRGVTPYLPGKAIAAVQRELGLTSIIKLASNENPLGPSPKAMAAYKRAAKDFNLYPEGGSPDLRNALAKFHNVDPESVLVGSGSDGILRLLCEAFIEPDDEVVVSQYGFIRYRQHAMVMGGKVIEVPMVDWTHDLDTMGKTASQRTKILFVANPNNPTGTYNSAEEVRGLLERVPRTTIVVLDEAYYDFSVAAQDYPRSLPELVKRYENLVVLRTFSKSYGLAGLRVGYAVGDPELIGWLDRVRLPFNVNLPAQRAAQAALGDKKFLKRSVAAAAKARETVSAGLRGLGYGVTDGLANFLFVQSAIPGRELFKRLLQAGVIVRPLDEYGLPNHLRISLGSTAQNKKLITALKKIKGAVV